MIEQILDIHEDADVFTLVDFMPQDGSDNFINDRSVKTSFIQDLPFAKRMFRVYLPLFPLAIEQLDITGYELVISSSYAVAKGVITAPDQLHVCYCHSPIRYAWDLREEYLRERNIATGWRSHLARLILHRIRMWDVVSAAAPDYFLANSEFVRARIQKFYRRPATVIYPPVDVHRFRPLEDKDDFYLTVSRSVPYKRVPLIVDAFRRTPQRRLVVIGNGPETSKVRAAAAGAANIEILGFQSGSVVEDYMRRARAFIFAAREDFGIVPVEAQACGTPVIAYGDGGVVETVRGSRLRRTSDRGVLRRTDIGRDHRRRRSLRTEPGCFFRRAVSRQRAAILSGTFPERIRRVRQSLSRATLARPSIAATHSSCRSDKRTSRDNRRLPPPRG